MSEFVDMLVDLLPMHSPLQKKDNPLRVVLDRSIGAYMDEQGNTFDEMFLTSASGSWLDVHGRDYGVPRRIGEDDEVYRERIIMEKNDRLTPSYLGELYGLDLYTYVSGYNPVSNTLTSDNPYVNTGDGFMSVADTDTQKILNGKFALDNEVFWL